MRSIRTGALAAPFPYFGGKSLACDAVWTALGDVPNYVEPFAGSIAMMLGRPTAAGVETINDADGFLANFWRSVAADPEATAQHADWPVNETDLFARHSWLVRHKDELLAKMHGDPVFFDPLMAGWWVWGLCAWIGDDWCSGKGPWAHDGETLVKRSRTGAGIDRKRPHLSDKGRGINRQAGDMPRGEFIRQRFVALAARLRDVRVCCGDWSRVLKPSVTLIHGLTGVFLDPPYTTANMDYSAGGVGGPLADATRAWCLENGDNPKLRIVLCGHAGEHDELLSHGWHLRTWRAHKGMAATKEAYARSASETLWCSPHCLADDGADLI